MKILSLVIVLIITILLTSCVDMDNPVGTGGVSPYVAYNTALPESLPETEYTPNPDVEVAIAGVTQTAGARNATATANIIYATQTTVARNATATQQQIYAVATQAAFNVTQTAVATATWKAEETAVYQPVALQQTRTANEMTGTREALNTQATATAVYLEIKTAELRAYQLEILGWVIVGAIGLSLLAAVFFLFGIAWRRATIAEAVYDDNGRTIAVDNKTSSKQAERAATS